MADALTIGGAVSGLKTAYEMLQALIGLRDARMIEAEVAKLNAVILAAQQSALTAQKEQLALLEEVGKLKARVVELEGKTGERERYKRTDMGGGTFAYTLKEGVQPGEDDHALCAPCYEKGHISTLQFKGTFAGQRHARCPTCKTGFAFGVFQAPAVDRGESRLTAARRGWGRK